MRALFLGRFQPMHNGHLKVIKDALKEFDELVIVIGSRQYDRVNDNPFSYEERKEMIEAALKDEKGKVRIFGMEDIHDNDEYVNHVEIVIPRCKVFFSGNTLTEQLFGEKGYDVRPLPRYDGLSSTQIRQLIREGGDWEEHVPKAVAKVLKRIEAKKILKSIR